MDRKLMFARPADLPSLGRNGRMNTVGVKVSAFPTTTGHTVEIIPVNGKGEPGRCEIFVNAEQAGEMAVFMAEAFAQAASPADMQDLLWRLEAVCRGRPDPVRQAEAAEREAAREEARAAHRNAQP